MSLSKYAKSILQDETDIWCYECGRTDGYIHRHEIFFGDDRQASIENGTWVSLCQSCHDKVHFGKDDSLKKKLWKEARERFIELYSEDKFNKTFSKSYED